jgi:hypothetical protein
MIIWLASYPRSGNSLLTNLLIHHLGIKVYSLYPPGTITMPKYTYERLQKDELPSVIQSQENFFIKTHEVPEDNYPAIYIKRWAGCHGVICPIYY